MKHPREVHSKLSPAERISKMTMPEKLALVERGDVPVDLMDAVQGELYKYGCNVREPNLDLSLWLSIKNYLAHKLDKDTFIKLFPVLFMFLVSCTQGPGKTGGVFHHKPSLDFIVAGQSNSVSPGNGQTDYSRLGLVTINDFYHGNAYRTPTQADPMDSGLAWIELGDIFAKPVTFTNVGAGGTNSGKWRYGLYTRITDQLKLKRFDALLWVQGESDYYEGLTQEESYQNLKWVILKTREIQPDLVWFVALDMMPVAQRRIVAEGLAEQGPDIDTLRAQNAAWFETSGAEFAGEGFYQHAKAWHDVLNWY